MKNIDFWHLLAATLGFWQLVAIARPHSAKAKWWVAIGADIVFCLLAAVCFWVALS